MVPMKVWIRVLTMTVRGGVAYSYTREEWERQVMLIWWISRHTFL